MDPFGMVRLPGREARRGGGVGGGATVAVVVVEVVVVVVAAVVDALFEVASFDDPAHAPAISVIAASRHAMIATRDHLRFMGPW